MNPITRRIDRRDLLPPLGLPRPGGRGPTSAVGAGVFVASVSSSSLMSPTPLEAGSEQSRPAAEPAHYDRRRPIPTRWHAGTLGALDDLAPPTHFPYGRYRRRIRLVATAPGVVDGGLEDDQHYFTVTLHHDGEHVVSVASDVGPRPVVDVSRPRRPRCKRSPACRCPIAA